jgi:ABC-type glycerol-3-phosphate transport system substrate-binding protein
MLKKIRTVILAGIVASTLAVSAGAQSSSPAQRPQPTTEDFTVWHKKGPSNGLIIAIGVAALVIIIGAVYLMRRRNDASK